MTSPLFKLFVHVEEGKYRIVGGRFGDSWASPYYTFQEFSYVVSQLPAHKQEGVLKRAQGGSGYPLPSEFTREEVEILGLAEKANTTFI